MVEFTDNAAQDEAKTPRQKAVEARDRELINERARKKREKIRIGTAKRDERLAVLGCECASCSTVCGLEYDLSKRMLTARREENPVHEYLAMRAYSADRLGGGGMGWHVFEFYVTCIALVMRLDKFNTEWDFDDDYIVDMRTRAFELAVEHGQFPSLGYEFNLEATRKYLEENPARTWDE